jgi:hypothetical protein
MLGGPGAVPGHLAGPGNCLVRRADGEVPEAVLGSERQAAQAMVECGFGAAEHGIHPRAQPFPARPVHRLAHLPPVVPARVRGVDYVVIVGVTPVRLLQQFPDAVEQATGQPPLIGGAEVERRALMPPVSLRAWSLALR